MDIYDDWFDGVDSSVSGGNEYEINGGVSFYRFCPERESVRVVKEGRESIGLHAQMIIDLILDSLLLHFKDPFPTRDNSKVSFSPTSPLIFQVPTKSGGFVGVG